MILFVILSKLSLYMLLLAFSIVQSELRMFSKTKHFNFISANQSYWFIHG